MNLWRKLVMYSSVLGWICLLVIIPSIILYFTNKYNEINNITIANEEKLNAVQATEYQYKIQKTYKADAENTPTPVLKSAINNDFELLNKRYGVIAGIRMRGCITEYKERVPNDADIQNIEDTLFNKYGPCWGVPEGQCQE